jgi:hypothetical protein
MKKLAVTLTLLLAAFITACDSGQAKNHQRGVYLLLDTSGTYTQELKKAQQIINYMLAHLEPGDSFAVARIDSGSFNEKDIIAKVVLDARPSASNRQKREFAATIDAFVKQVKSSAYTDISGGLLQAIEFLNETNVGQKHILIFSDLKEELPEGYVRDFDLVLDGFAVKALNVTKLRTDNQDPGEYLERVSQWQARVVGGGGSWAVINDLDRSDALSL